MPMTADEALAIADRARADEEATRRAYAESSEKEAKHAYIRWTRKRTLLRELERIVGEE